MSFQQAVDEGIIFPAAKLCAQGDGAVVFVMPVEIVSEMNRRDHWAVKYRRATRHKRMAHSHTLKYAHRLRARAQSDSDLCLMVRLIRIMRRRQRPFDGDNLQSGFKAIRDGVSQALGIDDGSYRIDWQYDQERGDGKGMVRIVIEEAGKEDAHG